MEKHSMLKVQNSKKKGGDNQIGEGRKGKRERRGNLLNVISSDVGGIIGCHHGLHLNQVLLHFLYTNTPQTISLYKEGIYLFLTPKNTDRVGG